MNSERVSPSILRWLGLFIGVLISALALSDQTVHADPPLLPSFREFYLYEPTMPGLITTWNQGIFGPCSQRTRGDAYSTNPNLTAAQCPGLVSPTELANPDWTELYGMYTYHVDIPSSYAYDEVRIEIFDPDTGNTATSTHHVYGVNGQITLNVSCPSPDRSNSCLLSTPPVSPNANPRWFVRMDEHRGSGIANSVYPTSGAPNQNNTPTLFRLYYLKQGSDGTLSEVDLAYYIGKAETGNASQNFASPTGAYTAAQAQAEALATDLQWVSPGASAAERMPGWNGLAGERPCVFADLAAIAAANGGTPPTNPSPPLCVSPEPATITEVCESYRAAHFGLPENGGYTLAQSCSGNGDFILDLTSELPGLFVDPATGRRSIFVQVHSLSGASENGFNLWAGPPRSADPEDFDFTVPANVNARQIYILGNAAPQYMRATGGVEVFARHFMPGNNLASFVPRSVPVTYIPPELSAQQVVVQIFDIDSGSQGPVIFSFEGIPLSQWGACFDDNTFPPNNCASFGLPRLGPADIITHSGIGIWHTYSFVVPATINGTPFDGRRLYLQYRVGQDDTTVLKLDCCSVTMIAPHSLQATVDGTDIDLSWVDASNNETYFVIERSYDGTAWTQIGMSVVPAFTDTSADLNSTPQYRVRAYHMDSNTFSDPSNVVIVDVSAPSITSANTTTFIEGFSNTFTVTATGDPAPTFSLMGGLPAGVSFDTTTGILSGAPAVGTMGGYPLIITASNGVLPDASQSFTLIVEKAAHIAEPVGNGSCTKLASIVNMKLRGMVAGRTYTYTFEVRDATTVYMIRQINSTFAGPTGTQIHFKWVIFPFDNVPALDAPQAYNSAWTALPTTATLKVTAVDRTTNLMSQTTMTYTCGIGAVSTSPPVFTLNVTGAPYAP